MKDSIRSKLEGLRDRYDELAGLLADPEVIADQARFRRYSQEYSQLEPVARAWAAFIPGCVVGYWL